MSAKSPKHTGTVSMDRVIAAYEHLMQGTDEPEVVGFAEAKCPCCRGSWEGLRSSCEHCGWPYER